jgi:hypothetical protein
MSTNSQTTFFQANVKLGTAKRTGNTEIKPKFICKDNVVYGNHLKFPLIFPAGTMQSSLASIENTNIDNGDTIQVEILDVNTNATIGTFQGTVTDATNNNIVECVIYRQ